MSKQKDNGAYELTDDLKPYFCPRCGRRMFQYAGDLIVIGTLRFVGSMRIKCGRIVSMAVCGGVVEWEGNSKKGRSVPRDLDSS